MKKLFITSILLLVLLTGQAHASDLNSICAACPACTALFFKVSGQPYALYPAGPAVGVTVTKSTTTNTYGAYAEMTASTAAAIYVYGVFLDTLNIIGTSPKYIQIAIGTGAAGAETVVAEIKLPIISTTPPLSPVIFPAPIAVPISTRIAVKWAGEGTNADTVNVTLLYVKQSGVN